MFKPVQEKVFASENRKWYVPGFSFQSSDFTQRKNKTIEGGLTLKKKMAQIRFSQAVHLIKSDYSVKNNIPIALNVRVCGNN